MVIGKVWKDANVLTFHDPTQGFDYIVSEYPEMKVGEPAILLLDINMPLLDGWEFLDNFIEILEKRKDTIDGRLIIYVLSSSVDKKDIEKAGVYTIVTDYLIKPITKDTISRISIPTKS